MKKNIYRTVLFILLLLAAGFSYSCSRLKKIDERNAAVPAMPAEKVPEATSPDADPAAPEETEISAETAGSLFVYVCGNVNSPDVYACGRGDRVIDAVRRAGGFTDGAAAEYLNLAEPVADGMKIYVPSVREVQEGTVPEFAASSGQPVSGAASAGSSKTGKVNINTASMEELMTLPGIGETRAQSIIDYRKASGKFKKAEDLMNIPGIKDGSFQKLKDHISV